MLICAARSLGIGSLMGDVVSRMMGSVGINGSDGLEEIGGRDGSTGSGRGGEKALKLGLSGCHDTTLAAVLASLGAFEGRPWPPYTSHIALELFRKSDLQQSRLAPALAKKVGNQITGDSTLEKGFGGWLGWLFGGSAEGNKEAFKNGSGGIARQKIEKLTDIEKSKLDGYFVRIRYNDEVMHVPGCKPVGRHLDGDPSFCTLVSSVDIKTSDANFDLQEAFKAIVDRYTPSHWKQACLSNLDVPAFPEAPQPAGH